MKRTCTVSLGVLLIFSSVSLYGEESGPRSAFPRGILTPPASSIVGVQSALPESGDGGETLRGPFHPPLMFEDPDLIEELKRSQVSPPRENPLQEDPAGNDPTITSHSLVQDFQGTSFNGWYPPDPVIAVGPNHVVVVVNSHWSAYNKSGVLVSGPTSLSSFFSSVNPPGNFVFDPKVIYDHYRDRFIILAPATDFSDSSSYMVAASDTSDPTGSWWLYNLDATLDDTFSSSNWADFPGLGFDEEALYITSNQFSFGGGYQYVKLRIVHIDSLYIGAPAVWFDFWDLRDNNNFRIFTLKPAHTFNGSGYLEYLLNTRSFGGSTVVLWSVANPLGTPILTREATLIVGSYSAPPNAEQMGSATRIHSGDSRTLDVVVRDGILYTAFTEAEDWGSGSVEAAIRYLKIDAVAEIVLENITFGANNLYYFYPSVYIDDLGDLALVFNRSGTSEYVGVHFTGKLASASNWEASQILKAGEASYVRFDGAGRNRWGDYSSAGLDPSGASPRSLWIYGEYARPSNTWGTWIGEINFPIVHDGGLVNLSSPPDTVFTDSTYAVQATVRNFGNVLETFDVIATINGYADTFQVSSLSPGDSFQITFSTWTAPSPDSTNYTMTVCTQVASDADTTNDCGVKSIFAFQEVHNGGVTSLDSPGDTVFTDSTYAVQATVQNSGTVFETFDVTATINGYADTFQVSNLSPGDSFQITFSTWTVPTPDSTSYSMTVCTQVSNDVDTTNDCRVMSIFAYTYRFHDIGVTALPSPLDTVWTDSTYTPEAWIQNFGNLTTSSIELIATIDGYADTQWVSSLLPGDSILVPFQIWTVPPADSATYLFSVCSNVVGDEDTTNNCGMKPIFAYIPVGVEEENNEYRISNIEFRLFQNHPNPFHSFTLIRYNIPVMWNQGSGDSGNDRTPVKLMIYDLTGRLVETLVDEVQKPGVYTLSISKNQLPSSGVYFYRLTTSGINESGPYTTTKKLILFH